MFVTAVHAPCPRVRRESERRRREKSYLRMTVSERRRTRARKYRYAREKNIKKRGREKNSQLISKVITSAKLV